MTMKESGWLLKHSSTKDYLVNKLKMALLTGNMELVIEAVAIAQCLPDEGKKA